MEKIGRTKYNDIPQVKETVGIMDIISKVDEIVAWINKQEQARGEHDPK